MNSGSQSNITQIEKKIIEVVKMIKSRASSSLEPSLCCVMAVKIGTVLVGDMESGGI